MLHGELHEFFWRAIFQSSPVLLDKGCKLNVHWMFRRCLALLLNVFCTFSFCHVPRGCHWSFYFSLPSGKFRTLLNLYHGAFSENILRLLVVKGTVMKIISEIYDRFNTNNKHWIFCIYSCPSFKVIEP